VFVSGYKNLIFTEKKELYFQNAFVLYLSNEAEEILRIIIAISD